MVQAPGRDAFQVLDWIMSRRVHEYLDVAGRPVGEGRAAAFRHVRTEMQSCPYAGGRYHHAKPMNVSALRQIIPAWEQILTVLSWLAQRFRYRHRKEVTTYDDLSLVTGAGVFLADFLVLRRHEPLRSHEIPLLISGIYKVCLGFQLATFLGSLRERFAPDTPEHLPDADGFYAHLEANELLIGEAEVCSGSAAMIMQAYDAMTGRHAVTPEALPQDCARLEIGWEQFDVFTDNAANVWNELVQYVIRMPQFLPELADPQLPQEARQRLNDHLSRRGAELLMGQKGLVVDIARAALEYCGRPASWHPEPLLPPTTLQPDGLAATVLAWLCDEAGADMQNYGPVVAGILQPQLARYDLYEVGVLAALNRQMSCLTDALGLDSPGATLTPSAISHVCGRTLRDWGKPAGKE
jgi:hypothetical protein